jgi:hypothetical protein
VYSDNEKNRIVSGSCPRHTGLALAPTPVCRRKKGLAPPEALLLVGRYLEPAKTEALSSWLGVGAVADRSMASSGP